MEVDEQSEHADLYKVLLKLEKEISESIRETYEARLNKPRVDEELDENAIEMKTRKLCLAMAAEIVEDFDPHAFNPIKNDIEATTLLDNDIRETEKCIIYKRKLIDKLQEEIDFYKKNIKEMKETMDEFDTKQITLKTQNDNEQIKNAKKMFNEMKNDLMYVVRSLYPNDKKYIITFLNNLVKRFFEDPNSYVELEKGVNSKILETLLDSGIIMEHPYQKTMFKLAL